MADFEDIRLDRPDKIPPGERSGLRGKGKMLALAVVVAIAAAAVALWQRGRHEPAPLHATHADEVLRPEPVRPHAEPGDNIPLPPLDATDPLVRELVGRLSTHPKVVAWLTTDQLIRNFTAAIVNVSGGRTAATQLRRARPDGPFTVVSHGSKTVIDPASYRRYDAYADAFSAIDARGAARLYATLQPRIQEAYRELGNPTGSVDGAVEQAIVQLLKTPIIQGDIAVERTTVLYRYADPALESLPSAQRQMLRMGPRNIRLVQAKLREIAPMLGIPDDHLPPYPTDRQ